MKLRKKWLWTAVVLLGAAAISFTIYSSFGKSRFELLPFTGALHPGKPAVLTVRGITPLFRQIELLNYSVSENGPRFLPPWKNNRSWKEKSISHHGEILLLPSQTGKFQGKVTLKISPPFKSGFTVELPFSGEVKPLVPANTPLLPAGEIIPAAKPRKLLYRIIAGAVILLLLAAALIIFLRRRKRTKAIAQPSLTERYLSELEQIEKQLAESTPEAALNSLYDLIKRFSQERFGLHAASATGDEFLKLWRNHADSVSAETADFLRHFTEISNTVKFARGNVDCQTMSFAVEVSRKWIKTSEMQEVKP